MQIVNEYNDLLTTQLESQKHVSYFISFIDRMELVMLSYFIVLIWLQYFESLLKEVQEETDREISKAVEKAVTQKLQKMQAKLDRCRKEKNILDDVSLLLCLWHLILVKDLLLATMFHFFNDTLVFFLHAA